MPENWPEYYLKRMEGGGGLALDWKLYWSPKFYNYNRFVWVVQIIGVQTLVYRISLYDEFINNLYLFNYHCLNPTISENYFLLFLLFLDSIICIFYVVSQTAWQKLQQNAAFSLKMTCWVLKSSPPPFNLISEIN